MKPTALLLAASLAANALLIALWILRPAPPSATPAGVATVPSPARPAAGDYSRVESLVAALAAGDSAALTAAGVSPEVVRQLAAARAFGRLATISRAIDGPPDAAATTDYWRTRRAEPRPPPTREQRAERHEAEREFQEAMRAAFGDAIDLDSRSRAHRFLPPEKQELLRRIERDYDEMMRDITDGSGSLQLAADREKLKLLRAEKERDVAAALSPEEREQLEVRTSRSAQSIIGRYGDVLRDEAEFRRLYALQKAFDDQYTVEGRASTLEENRLRQEAERRLNDDLRAALGDERWAQSSRATDGEYRLLGDLATRLNLPAGTADTVYAVRDTYGAQSVAIQRNPALSAEERRQQLIQLAARARADLTTRLGTEGAEAYANRSQWLRLLQGGTAFITDPRQLPAGSPRPGAGTTVYPLPPTRPAATAPPQPKG